MQAAKDTFYVTLRDRLATINPARTVAIDGVSRPAVLVSENERPEIDGSLPEVFYVSWGETKSVCPDGLKVGRCLIRYHCVGSSEMAGADRGRKLGLMDRELEQMLTPTVTQGIDPTTTPTRVLSTSVFWKVGAFGLDDAAERDSARVVPVDVYYFEERANSV